MEILDSHHHLWTRSRHPQPWIDPTTMAAIDADFEVTDFLAVARPAGVSGSVVVQSVPSHDETLELLSVAERSAFVRGVVGWTDLEAPDIAEHLAALRAAPGGDRLVGIRHPVQDEPDPGYLHRPGVRRGVAAVGHADLVFDLLVTHRQLAAAGDVVRDVPGTTFVLDHLGKPDLVNLDLVRWGQELRALAQLPNVVAKVSGLVTEARWTRWTPDDLRPAVAQAFDAFGPDRVMFGSDWPVVNLASGYGQWRDTAETLLPASLAHHDRQAFWGGNARRIYGAGGAPA